MKVLVLHKVGPTEGFAAGFGGKVVGGEAGKDLSVV